MKRWHWFGRSGIFCYFWLCVVGIFIKVWLISTLAYSWIWKGYRETWDILSDRISILKYQPVRTGFEASTFFFKLSDRENCPLPTAKPDSAAVPSQSWGGSAQSERARCGFCPSSSCLCRMTLSGLKNLRFQCK